MGEQGDPGGPHLLGACVALVHVLGKGALEERGQPVADCRVEALGIDADHAAPRAVLGQLGTDASGHLVQHGRGRVAVGRRVPAAPQMQPGISPLRRARGHGFRLPCREREVVQGQVHRLLGLGREPEVPRLDVPVRDVLFLEVQHGGQQVVAVAPRLLQAERALGAQKVGQGVIAGKLHQQAGPPADLLGLVQLHHVLVPQPAQHARLVLEPVAATLVVGNLQRVRGVAAPHLEHLGRGSGAQNPDDLQVAIQHVALGGLARIDALVRGRLRARQGVEQVDLVPLQRVVRPAGVEVLGGPRDRRIELGQVTADRGHAQAVLCDQLVLALGECGRRMLAGEHQPGQAAEAEYVALLGGLGRVADDLRGLVEAVEILGKLADVSCPHAGTLRVGGGLEAVQAYGQRVDLFPHQHGRRRQVAVQESGAVAMVQGLRHLLDQGQAVVERQVRLLV